MWVLVPKGPEEYFDDAQFRAASLARLAPLQSPPGAVCQVQNLSADEMCGASLDTR